MKTLWQTITMLVLVLNGCGVRAQQISPLMLARGGSVAVKVADYGTAQAQVRQLAVQAGALVMDMKTSVNDKGRKHGWMSLRVPEASLPVLIASVQSVGRLYSENLTTTDNQSDYEELARRILRLQQHEQRLNALLQSPRRMRGSDILYLQDRLFRASVAESLLTQQRVDLVRAGQQNALVVELFEPGSLPPVPGQINLAQRYRSAVGHAHAVWNTQMGRAATATAYLAVFAVLWVPLLGLALLLLAWLWRYRRILAHLLLRTLEHAIAWLRERWDNRYGPRGFSEPVP